MRYEYTPRRVIDIDGISDGAVFYFYKTGSTTPVSMFYDSAYLNPAPNPFTVSAGAKMPFLYTDYVGDLRVRIVNTSGEVDEQDPYQDSSYFIRGELSSTASDKGASLIKTQLGDTLEDAITANRFFNVAAVQAYTIPSAIKIINTLNYATEGDGGGTEYKKVATQPTHPGKIQSADGAWWEICPKDGRGKVESFGALATDNATDAATNRTALRNAHIAWKAGVFRELLYAKNGVYHIGAFTGAQTSLFGSTHLNKATGIIQGNGAILKFSEDRIATHDIYLFTENNNIIVDNLHFENTGTIDPSGDNPHGVRCLSIYGSQPENARNFVFQNCTFTRCFGTVSCFTGNPNATTRISGIRVNNCIGYDCFYGPSFNEDGDNAEIDFTGFNIRRIYFVYGVRGHRSRLTVSHDGVALGSDGTIKIKRYVRDTIDIQISAIFSGSVAATTPVNIEHQNDTGGAAGDGSSLIDGIKLDLTFPPTVLGGSGTPGVLLTSLSSAGVAYNTPLQLAGDTNSPVTSKHRTTNLEVTLKASTWGNNPYIEANFVPAEAGIVKTVVPTNINFNDVRLNGFEVNGYFESVASGNLNNLNHSIPLKHVRNSRVAIEVEIMATDGVATTGKTFLKKYITHGYVLSDGTNSGIGSLTQREDLSVGTPDLVVTQNWGNIDRLNINHTSVSNFTANSYVRVRSKINYITT